MIVFEDEIGEPTPVPIADLLIATQTYRQASTTMANVDIESRSEILYTIPLGHLDAADVPNQP